MPEVGGYYDREKFAKVDTDEEEASDGISERLKDEITAIKNQCAHVYGEPENGEKLNQLIADAQEFYSANEEGWDQLLNDTRKALASEEDSAAIEDILRSAISEGVQLMD